jgi:hypothetical protein
VGCTLLQDAEGTPESGRGDTLHVGVTEAPPFVVRRGGAEEPGSVEAALVRGFADSFGATVAWHWGPLHEHSDWRVYDVVVVPVASLAPQAFLDEEQERWRGLSPGGAYIPVPGRTIGPERTPVTHRSGPA